MTEHTESFHERFRAVATAAPDRTAVIGPDGRRTTYAELAALTEAATRSLAARLRAEDCVVVEAERHPRHLAAMLAAWRLGLAYVPLRAHESPARREHVLRQLAGRALLVSGDAAAARIGRVDRRRHGELPEPLRWPSGQAAYVVFTSGSTGTPKGTVLTAEGFTARLDWSQRCYPLTTDDVLLQHTAVSFDFAIWEAAAALLHGAALLLTEDGPYTDPEEAVESAVRHRATVAHFVPSVLSLVEMSGLLAGWTSLRLLYSGGEQLRGTLAQRVLRQAPHTQLVNQYGPAETCVDSTHHPCTPPLSDGPVPIGRAIDGTRLTLLPVPGLGPDAGELLIGGPGVGFGYLDPADPAGDRFGHDRHGRTFRTGDLVHRLPDGDLLFLGRADDQVKVGGVRVELGEIETIAASFPGVTAAVALAVPGPDGTSLDLVVESPRADLDVRALRGTLTERLMGPVTPRRLRVVTALPRTAGGKVDRARLAPAPRPAGTPPAPGEPAQEAAVRDTPAPVPSVPSPSSPSPSAPAATAHASRAHVQEEMR
ncbi:AMP-binding protein [Streptomyces sp. NPDC014805]|uniref:AMP-binding protein n=1 Tax=Streptomyces sp. NPDC014805 TaxID=3364919 RepID=UPI0036F6713B